MYKLHTESPGMLTLVVAAQGGMPSLKIETAGGRPLVGIGLESGAQPDRQIRGGNGLILNDAASHFDGGGYQALSPDGSNIAYTLPIDSAGNYKVTLAAAAYPDESTPFASAQWLALPTPEEQRQQAADAPEAPALDPDNILNQATPVTPGQTHELNTFDHQDRAWLVFEAEQPGMLVVTARSDDADVRLALHHENSVEDPFLHIDADRNGDLGNEATVLPLAGEQRVLICVISYGDRQAQSVRFHAVFVPDPPAEDAPAGE